MALGMLSVLLQMSVLDFAGRVSFSLSQLYAIVPKLNALHTNSVSSSTIIVLFSGDRKISGHGTVTLNHGLYKMSMTDYLSILHKHMYSIANN